MKNSSAKRGPDRWQILNSNRIAKVSRNRGAADGVDEVNSPDHCDSAQDSSDKDVLVKIGGSMKLKAAQQELVLLWG